jgi:AcrR family transcriptional regulator
MAQLETLGYQHMTIEGVAAQAGVGKATVYRWWSSKAQLVVEALSDRCHLEPAANTGDLRTDVRGLVEHVVGVISKTPLGRILPQLLVDLENDSPARRKLQEWLGPARARNRGLLYAAAGRAELPHDIDATLLLDLLGGAVLWRTLLGRKPDARLVEQLTDLVVDRALPRANPEDDDSSPL